MLTNKKIEVTPQPPTFAPLDAETIGQLNSVSTATLCTQLWKRGFLNQFMGGIEPLRPDLRMCGRAVTLRYIPAREDLGDPTDVNSDAQRKLVEQIGAGEILVVDAREKTHAATLGNILATRMFARGAAGIVSDGCFRDYPEIKKMNFPTFARGKHAGTNLIAFYPADFNLPIGCGGVAVLPGDVLVGDAEGVIVIPFNLVGEVARDAVAQEKLEDFILAKVRGGVSIRGVYPPGAETLAEFEKQN